MVRCPRAWPCCRVGGPTATVWGRGAMCCQEHEEPHGWWATGEEERGAGLGDLSAEVQVGTRPYFQWEERTPPSLSILQLAGHRFALWTKPGEQLPGRPFVLSILRVGAVLAAGRSPKAASRRWVLAKAA